MDEQEAEAARQRALYRAYEQDPERREVARADHEEQVRYEQPMSISTLRRQRQANDERFMPVREAEQLLGLSRNSVRRRIKLGILQGYPDPENGYFHVSRASVQEALRRRKEIQDLAEATLPGAR